MSDADAKSAILYNNIRFSKRQEVFLQLTWRNGQPDILYQIPVYRRRRRTLT